MTTLDFNLEIKAADETDWTFEGIASPFNGPADSYGDIIEAGAYVETLAKHHRNGTMPIMLWSHDQGEPIGVWKEFHEEGRGLYGRGQLLKGIRRAEEAYILLKNRAIRGLSIGYRAVEAEPDGAYLRLKKIDLHEVSIVAIAAAPRARVTEIKHSDNTALLRARLLAGEPPSDRELEKGMRDAFNLTNSQAERAVRLFRRGQAQGEPGDEKADDGTQTAVALLREALKGFTLPSRI